MRTRISEDPKDIVDVEDEWPCLSSNSTQISQPSSSSLATRAIEVPNQSNPRRSSRIRRPVDRFAPGQIFKENR